MNKQRFSAFLIGTVLTVFLVSLNRFSLAQEEGNEATQSSAPMIQRAPTRQTEEPAAPSEEIGLNAAPTLSSIRVAGSALRPGNSTVGWPRSGGGGCIYASEGSANIVWNTPVYLPRGSTVDHLRMYYDNTTVEDCTGWFTVYNQNGDLVIERSMNSVGTGGHGFADTSTIDHTIDYSQYSYVLNWRPNHAGIKMQLCGFRIFYTPPAIRRTTVVIPLGE
jgi:hypothetical protein